MADIRILLLIVNMSSLHKKSGVKYELQKTGGREEKNKEDWEFLTRPEEIYCCLGLSDVCIYKNTEKWGCI